MHTKRDLAVLLAKNGCHPTVDSWEQTRTTHPDNPSCHRVTLLGPVRTAGWPDIHLQGGRKKSHCRGKRLSGFFHTSIQATRCKVDVESFRGLKVSAEFTSIWLYEKVPKSKVVTGDTLTHGSSSQAPGYLPPHPSVKRCQATTLPELFPFPLPAKLTALSLPEVCAFPKLDTDGLPNWDSHSSLDAWKLPVRNNNTHASCRVDCAVPFGRRKSRPLSAGCARRHRGRSTVKDTGSKRDGGR